MKASKLPWAVKQQCLWIVRDYERMRREYRRMRRDILDAGGANYVTYTENGEERRAYMPSQHNASRSTEDRQMQLEGLESSPMVRQLRAVEHAKSKIGRGMPEMLQDALQEAIMTNCQSGRKYPYERLFVVGVCRTDFYVMRDEFFHDIAEELGLI